MLMIRARDVKLIIKPIPGSIPVERGNAVPMLEVEVKHALNSNSECCASAEGYQLAVAGLDIDFFDVFCG
jgi:hypothetical protein